MNEQLTMMCDGCSKPILHLRLIKWQEWDTIAQQVITKRLWLCLQCWLEHGGEVVTTEDENACTQKRTSLIDTIGSVRNCGNEQRRNGRNRRNRYACRVGRNRRNVQ
jgi:hypothetical protein